MAQGREAEAEGGRPAKSPTAAPRAEPPQPMPPGCTPDDLPPKGAPPEKRDAESAPSDGGGAPS